MTTHAPELGALAGRISYAQCWEDERVLLSALHVGEGDDVLSIASAGDNSIALALAGARSVTAIDLSFPQLALTELKLAGGELEYDEFLALLGLRQATRRGRASLYACLRPTLSPAARAFWDVRPQVIGRGVLQSGRLERFLEAFRSWALPLVHSRRTVEELLALDGLAEQRAFFDERWNTRRWRALFQTFFCQPIIERFGRDPAQFAHVRAPVAQTLLARAEHALTQVPIRNNPYLEWILSGTYRTPESARPYLSREGHARLGEVRGRVRLVHAELGEHLASVPEGSYSAFNYSNVFEYVSAPSHEALLRQTIRAARPGARIAYWNLFVPRSRPESLAGRLRRRATEAAAALLGDRAFLYGAFNIEVVQ